MAGFSPKLGEHLNWHSAKFLCLFCGRNIVQSAQNVTCSQGMFDNVKGEHFLPEDHVVGWLKLSGGSPSADFKQGKYHQIYQIICFLLLFPVYRLSNVFWGSSGQELPFGTHRLLLVDKVKTSAFLFVICCTLNFFPPCSWLLCFVLSLLEKHMLPPCLKCPDPINQGKFIDYISSLIILFYRVELCLIYPSHLFAVYIHLAESSCVV